MKKEQKLKITLTNLTNNDVDQAKTDGASAITKIQPDVVKSQKQNAIDDENS